MSDTIVEAVPAASVLLLRGGASDLEILFLRRNPRLAFHGGSWVFPGGRIDPEDYPDDGDEEGAARRAVVRESEEEAGLDVEQENLVPVAHWTTPAIAGVPRRFATWFFVGHAPDDSEVKVDGGEIHEHRWMRPADALAAQASGEMSFAAPSFVLTTRIAELGSALAALQFFASRGLDVLLPKIIEAHGGRVALYGGDAGYEEANPRAAGARHRLWMVEGRWRYERSV